MPEYHIGDAGGAADQSALGLPAGSVIFGGAGNDTITMQSGSVVAGGGDNRIILPAGSYVQLAYWNSPAGISADLTNGLVANGYGGQDTIVGVPQVFVGSAFGDLIVAGANSTQFFYGSAGNDTYNGSGTSVLSYYQEPRSGADVAYDLATATWTITKHFPDGVTGTDVLHGVSEVVFADATVVHAATPYFSVDSSQITSFAAYYAAMPKLGGAVLIDAIKPFTSNGVTYVAFFLQSRPATVGVQNSAPTPTHEIILKGNGDGSYSDVTAQMLGPSVSGASGLVLHGAPAAVATADINGDGRPDIIISENNEDGRKLTNAGESPDLRAIAQVQVSQADGTYITLDLDSPMWGAVGSISVHDGVISLSGINQLATSTYLDPSHWSFRTEAAWRLNSAGTGFVQTAAEPGYNYGSARLSDSQVVVAGFKTLGSSSAEAYGVLNKDAGGAWSIGSAITPFAEQHITNFVTWAGNLQEMSVVTVGGMTLIGALHGVLGAAALSDDGHLSVITYVTGVQLSGVEADGNYHEADGLPSTHFEIYDVVNGALTLANVRLVGVETQGGPNGFKMLDLDHDGRLDLVITQPVNAGGGPVVYMNEGHGLFVHVDPAIFAGVSSVGVDLRAGSVWADLTPAGSGFDVIYAPFSVSFGGDNPPAQPLIAHSVGPFPNGVFSMSAADVGGAIDDLKTLADAGHLNSVRLTDPGSAITISPQQLAADAVVLGKVITTYGLAINGGAGADAIVLLQGNETAHGGAGDDLITGAAGNDVIDGGDGVDAAVFSGAASDYKVTQTAGGWTVQDLRAGSPDGTDTLTNVEVLKFSDKSIALTAVLPAGLDQSIQNVLRATPTSTAAAALTGDIMLKLSSGALTQTTAVDQIVKAAATTSSVATMSYEFFTGTVPSSGGMDFLVSPTGPNSNNLNSAYYQSFNIENRYINFAVNLGKNGAGNAAFTAGYGSLDLFHATQKAYGVIFGITPSDTKVHALLDPLVAANTTRADYFAYYGGDGANGIGTKAAMVGWLLAEAVLADVGSYAKSNDAFLTDVALHNASYLVDMIGHYNQASFAFNGG